MRVHELAKEFGVPSKELLARLHQLGVQAASHMTVVEETAVEILRQEFGKAKAAPAAADLLPEEKIVLEHHAQLKKFRDELGEVDPADAGARTWNRARHKARKGHDRDSGFAATSSDGKTITIQGPIVVRDLADRMGVRPNLLIAELMKMNILASITERLDVNVARSIAEKHGLSLEHEKKTVEHAEVLRQHRTAGEKEEPDRPEDLVIRPPVVTFMGHVDHGKTSLLDKIRNASVAKGEHGGITQHIGAYTVEINGRRITFLDTPGHAAFTSMRARGANLTDIAVIVIAADDGIMPQTREALMHAKAANVAIMVAINKTDLPSANVDLAKKQLQSEGLLAEDWGGATICVPVSAVTGKGIPHLLEMILLQADVLDLKANPKRRASGFVIEAQLQQGMGPTATLLVTGGTLHMGDIVVCGPYWGRVRALMNDHGAKVKSAGPGMPIKCLGLSGVPDAGAEFVVCTNDKMARDLAEASEQELRSQRQVSTVRPKMSLDLLFDHLKEDSRLELKVILKTDTQGSIEAITQALQEIKSEKISLDIILSSIGNITTNDVMLASASSAVILGFHVSKEPGIDAEAKHEGVEIRLHHIIYELVDQVRDAMLGLLTPETKEKIIGRAEIRAVFSMGKTARIAGCMITQGHALLKSRVRVKRGPETLFEGGSMASMKHFQNDASEVKEGQECGIRLDKFANFAVGDILEFYVIEELQVTL